MKHAKEDFKRLYGYEPEHDDLERVNCRKAGNPGHTQCGYCNLCLMPRFMCGCRYVKGEK